MPAGRRPRATLESVARSAGVSRQTVSNVLHAPHRVAPATLDRVRAAIEAHEYRPSRAAQQLRTRRSRTLGMRLGPQVDGINGSVLDRFLHALVDRAQADGHHVLLFTAVDDDAEIAAYEDLLSTADLEGMVLTSTHHRDERTAWLAERGVPFTTFGRPWGAARATHAWVDVDGRAGTAAAVAHCVGLGHRRIAFVGWPPGSGVGDDRRAGWAAAVAAAGIASPPALDRGVEDGIATGRAAVHELLQLPDPPTAVVCASDSLALGALAATGDVDSVLGPARSADAVAPRLAVIGFDDTPVAAAIGLTSVAQPLEEAARTCFELLMAQVEAIGAGLPPPAPQTHLLAPRLAHRRTA